MGLISAGDEFNRRGDDAIAGIPNVKKIVEEIRPRGRSYLVKTESGRLYWRNRRYLKLYAPPIGVAKDIPESQEEVKQPRRSKRQKKAP
ncbi:Uncharacterized protein FKW44_022666, partial [Caligus rogercresseyi]